MKRAETFTAFLKHFNKEEMPITLSEDNVVYFSAKNKPLPAGLIRKFLLQTEKATEEDEFTEYVPCCIIPDTGDIKAVIYWKGMLLSYDFILATYDKNGVLIAKKAIAGIRSEAGMIKRSVATINEDWVITIVIGQQKEGEHIYDSANSQTVKMELLPDGEIVFSLKE